MASGRVPWHPMALRYALHLPGLFRPLMIICHLPQQLVCDNRMLCLASRGLLALSCISGSIYPVSLTRIELELMAATTGAHDAAECIGYCSQTIYVQ